MTIRRLQPRTRRGKSRGATIVEFALVAPVFFGALFGSLDGGVLLYSANAINHATGLGMIVLAQEGNLPAADTDAVAAVTSGGFSSTGFAKLDEIDIFLVHVDATTGAVTQDTNSCSGSACFNRYDGKGNAIGGTVPWPPGVPAGTPGFRDTSSLSLTNIGITIKTHYNYLAFNSAKLNMVSTRYFRLEPQS